MGTHFTRIYHHEERTVLSEVVFMKNLKELIILHSNDMHGDFLAEQIEELCGLKRVIGLAEVMDFLAVIHGEDRMMDILKVILEM